jgi:HEPN domain-containing protein
MTPPDEVAKQLSRGWLSKAAADLRVCDLLSTADGDQFEAIAFHAQQAAEKALKAYLVWHQVEFPKTHDIQRLLELVAGCDEQLAHLLARAADLTPYGVEYRYPGEYPLITRDDAASAVAISREVRGEVIKRLPADARDQEA